MKIKFHYKDKKRQKNEFLFTISTKKLKLYTSLEEVNEIKIGKRNKKYSTDTMEMEKSSTSDDNNVQQQQSKARLMITKMVSLLRLNDIL